MVYEGGCRKAHAQADTILSLQQQQSVKEKTCRAFLSRDHNSYYKQYPHFVKLTTEAPIHTSTWQLFSVFLRNLEGKTSHENALIPSHYYKLRCMGWQCTPVVGVVFSSLQLVVPIPHTFCFVLFFAQNSLSLYFPNCSLPCTTVIFVVVFTDHWHHCTVTLQPGSTVASLHLLHMHSCIVASITQMHRCMVTRLYRCTVALLHRCTDALLHGCTVAQMHRCTVARLHRCTDAQLHRCTVARLHGCTVARLHGCTVALLHRCTVARLHGCTVAQLHRCTVAQMHRCTVPLHGCTVARLHGCTVAPLHRCTDAQLHRCTVAPSQRS